MRNRIDTFLAIIAGIYVLLFGCQGARIVVSRWGDVIDNDAKAFLVTIGFFFCVLYILRYISERIL